MPVEVTAVVDQPAERHHVLTSVRRRGLAVADEEESDDRSWEGGDTDGAQSPDVAAGGGPGGRYRHAAAAWRSGGGRGADVRACHPHGGHCGLRYGELPV